MGPTSAYPRTALFTVAGAAVRCALAQAAYEEVTLVGKSSGTLAMARLLSDDGPLSGARAVWPTPLLKDHAVRERILATAGRSLSVIGTADPHYEPGLLPARAESVVIEGADHSLEVRAGTWESLRVLERTLRSIEAFVAGDGEAL